LPKGTATVANPVIGKMKPFAQSRRTVSLGKKLIETGDFATRRDAHYQTRN